MNDKQRTFCKEYMKDLNGTQAAIRAGYSEKTAKQIANQLLSKLDLKEYIAELKKERAEACEVDAEWVLREAVDTYQAARDKDDVKGATGALNLIGKHVDVKALVDRKEVRHSGEVSLSEAERQIRARHILEKVAERKGKE